MRRILARPHFSGELQLLQYKAGMTRTNALPQKNRSLVAGYHIFAQNMSGACGGTLKTGDFEIKQFTQDLKIRKL